MGSRTNPVLVLTIVAKGSALTSLKTRISMLFSEKLSFGPEVIKGRQFNLSFGFVPLTCN